MMVFKLSGEIYKTGTTKKGGHFFNVIVKRPDGQSDTICVFTDKDSFKAGQKYDGMVNIYAQMCNEVK